MRKNGTRKRGDVLSGAATIKKAGKRGILIAVYPADKELLQKAAARERRSLSAFIAHHAIEAAIELTSLFPRKGK